MNATKTWTDEARGAWRELYDRRLMSAEEAVSQVKSGDSVWISPGQRVNQFLSALLGRVTELENVEVKCLPMADYGWYGDAVDGHLRVNAVHAAMPDIREAINNGRADFTPGWLWDWHRALQEGRPEARPIDVALISVTPPNEWGYCCFGNSLWDAKTTAELATLVFAEVHDSIIRTFGDSWIHVSEIDGFVEVAAVPAPERNWPTPEPDPWNMPIAEYVGSLVNDRDTIQIGTGSTSGFIPRSGVLDDKHDLGVFTELTVPGFVELVQKGVATSRYMETHPGKFISTTAGNGAEDLAFIDGNPMFEFYPPSYMHNPAMIARNDNMIAINNAITVDLGGQIGASTIGPAVFSGTGGHFSYALGASMSAGGRYICVLPSTAVGGTKSRIVSLFDPGQVVTVPRDMADTVVTEYGIARLLNKTLRERASELISIAHPDFRAELRREATHLF